MKSRLRILIAVAMLGVAALVVGLMTTGAAGKRSGPQARAVVYQVAVSFRDHGKTQTQVEWVSPTTGEWRIREGNRIKIFSGGRYTIIDPANGTYLRTGSGAFLGYLANGALSARPLARYLSGDRSTMSTGPGGVQVGRTSSGRTVLQFRRDGVPLRAVVMRSMPLATARARGFFRISEQAALTSARERPAGARPTLPVRAYWFGPEFGEHRAVTSIEHSRDVRPEVASTGENGDRLRARAYITMYELPSAGSESSAIPGRMAPEGEIQVVSQPISLATSQAGMRALNGVNGTERYDPWPRQHVRLANGEPATVVPNLSEGTYAGASGAPSVWQFAVMTGETLTWVSGGFALSDIAEVASSLRPVDAK